MIVKKIENIDYIIFDPSKNITALVISKVDVLTYKDISEKIMDKEPLVEQVGFLTFDGESDISLRMAGGEFCGNATMCAAVYHAMKNELLSANVKVKVFGTDGLIDVEIKKIGDSEWEGTVKMPKPLEIKDVTFPNGKTFPVMSFEGISHVIIIDDGSNQSNFTKEEAESVIKEWCDFLNVPALGIMHYDMKNSNLVPLVYVKSVDTLFWENSCASGTTAIGAWLFKKENDKKGISIEVKQPSKSILTICNDEKEDIYLKGKVRLGA